MDERNTAVNDDDAPWLGISLADVEAKPTTPPTRQARTDGIGTIPDGALTVFGGEPGGGKSWHALHEAHMTARRARAVIYVDGEGNAPSMKRRLLQLGVTPQELEWIVYEAPAKPITEGEGRDNFECMVSGVEPDLVIFDGLTALMALHGLEIDSNSAAATFLELLVRPLARQGITTIVIGHVAKNIDRRGRWLLGAGHWIGAADVGFTLEAPRAWGRGQNGHAVLRVAKHDRDGWLASHAALGDPVVETAFTSGPDGSLELTLHPPGWAAIQGELEGREALARVMEEYSLALEDAGSEGITKGELRDRTLTGVSRLVKSAALDALVGRGDVSVEDGAKRARVHRSVRPFRASAEGATPSVRQCGTSVDHPTQEVSGSVDPTKGVVHVPHTDSPRSDEEYGTTSRPDNS
ncbi:MAG: AAA family ATPase [Acidimicrobiia bacterium]